MEDGKGLLALIYNIGVAVGQYLRDYGHNPNFIRINPKTLETWGEGKVKSQIAGIPVVQDETVKLGIIEVQ